MQKGSTNPPQSSPLASSAGPPTIDTAASVLPSVQSTSEDKAVDCLMSLAAFGGGPPTGGSGQPLKLPEGTAVRRKLAMRTKKPVSQPTALRVEPEDASGVPNPGRDGVCDLGGAGTSREPPCIAVPGVIQPVRLLSGATVHQLRLLAAAFKLCPSPSPEQLEAVAHRVGISASKLGTWFQSRRTLHEWMVEQPHLQPADIATMFFENADGTLQLTPTQPADRSGPSASAAP